MYTFLVSSNCGPVNLHFENLSGVNLQRLKKRITKDRDKYARLRMRARVHRCGHARRGGLSSRQINASFRVVRVSRPFRRKHRLINRAGSQRGRGGIDGVRQRRATGSRPEGGNFTDETLFFLPLLVVCRERAASPSAQILDVNLCNPHNTDYTGQVSRNEGHSELQVTPQAIPSL